MNGCWPRWSKTAASNSSRTSWPRSPAKPCICSTSTSSPRVQTGGGDRAAEALADVRRRYWEGLLGNVSERLIVSARPVDEQPTAVALRPLTYAARWRATWPLVGPADDFVDFDHQVADRAASVLAIELAKQSAVVEARLRLQGDFLTELLDSPAPPKTRCSIVPGAWAMTSLLRTWYSCCVRAAAISTAPASRGHQRFVDATRRRLVLADVTTLLREREGSVQVLMPCPADLDPPTGRVASPGSSACGLSLEESWRRSGCRRRRRRAHAVPRRRLRGHARGDPRGRHRRQHGRRSRPRCTSPAGALRLIFHLADNPELRAFQRDVLGPLEIPTPRVDPSSSGRWTRSCAPAATICARRAT